MSSPPVEGEAPAEGEVPSRRGSPPPGERLAGPELKAPSVVALAGPDGGFSPGGRPDGGSPDGGSRDDERVASASSRTQYSSPGRSALAHWRVVAALTVMGLAIGTDYAYVRTPTYTSSAYLFVGKTLSLENTAAIPGLASAAASVAEDYSRLIDTPSVTARIASALGQNRVVDGSVTASVVAETPEIVVTASAGSAERAVTLANTGASALVTAVNQINSASSADLNGLRSTYVKLEQQINTDQLAEQSLQSQLGRAESADQTSPQSVALRTQLAALQTQVSQDGLDASTAETQYSDAYSPLVAEEQVLKIQSRAISAVGDRKKTLEVSAIGGLFGGGLLGVLAASALDVRADRSKGGRGDIGRTNRRLRRVRADR